MQLRELYEADGKVAVTAFGRMNPPTIGHKLIADKMKSMQGDHFIFVTHTQDAKKNPLNFADKVRFAKASFGNHVTVGNEEVKTIIQMMQKLESLGYTEIMYVAGSDRVDQFEKLLNDYNGKDYNFDKITIVNAGERDPDADGAEGMSASKMRAAAVEGKFEEFKQGVADQSIAQEMYDTIRKNMGIQERELTKGEEKEKERIVKGMKKSKGSFKKRYGKDSKAVMYATATKLAKEDTPVSEFVGIGLNAYKYGKYTVKIAKWLYNNKWAITFFIGLWKVGGWVKDAMAWAKRFLDHPITQALGKYGLPAIAIAVALYGGRKLYMELVSMEREGMGKEEMKKQLAEFKPDTKELKAFEKEMEDLVADTEDLDELNLFKNKGPNNASVKEQDPNKVKVLDWIAARNDGKEHFLSFYRPGAAFSGNLIYIRPEAAKRFMKVWDANEEHHDRMKKALTSVQTTSTLFKNLNVKHDVRRAQ
tara:strand:- start:1014 stop:2444 length:1431 start_codon:yes stop_codon:yes gene_type:complete